MLNFIKLGLYFSLVGHYRLDPMVFELINEERRRERESANTADEQAQQHIEQNDDDIRKAA